MICKRDLIASVTAAVLGFALALGSAAARTNGIPADDPLNPAHVAGLPAEVRSHIESMARDCGSPVTALHTFSRYMQQGQSRFIALHFDEARCAKPTALCRPTGCLHQVYASTDNHPYQLVLSTYAPEIELRREGNVAGVEITQGNGTRFLRWNGAGFR